MSGKNPTGFQHAFRPQELYSEDRRVWNAIFEVLCKDLGECERNGVFLEGENDYIYPIVLGNKGDWSYLVLWLHFMYVDFPQYSTCIDTLEKPSRFMGLCAQQVCFGMIAAWIMVSTKSLEFGQCTVG